MNQQPDEHLKQTDNPCPARTSNRIHKLIRQRTAAVFLDQRRISCPTLEGWRHAEQDLNQALRSSNGRLRPRRA